jgi:hypothetical protein
MILGVRAFNCYIVIAVLACCTCGARGFFRGHCVVWRQQKRRSRCTHFRGNGELLFIVSEECFKFLVLPRSKSYRACSIVYLNCFQEDRKRVPSKRSRRVHRCGSTNLLRCRLLTMPPVRAGSMAICNDCVESNSKRSHFLVEKRLHTSFWATLTDIPSSASTCSPKAFRLHFHPFVKTTAACMRKSGR